jgi:hypothetical protein
LSNQPCAASFRSRITLVTESSTTRLMCWLPSVWGADEAGGVNPRQEAHEQADDG